jgi:hypothetical protein
VRRIYDLALGGEPPPLRRPNPLIEARNRAAQAAVLANRPEAKRAERARATAEVKRMREIPLDGAVQFFVLVAAVIVAIWALGQVSATAWVLLVAAVLAIGVVGVLAVVFWRWRSWRCSS